MKFSYNWPKGFLAMFDWPNGFLAMFETVLLLESWVKGETMTMTASTYTSSCTH